MAANALNTLREALFATGMVQPLDGSGKGKSVSLLCRQIKGQEAAWILAIDRILEVSESEGFDSHICRRYVRREGKIAFGWFLEFSASSAKGLVQVVDRISEILRSIPRSSEQAPAQKIFTSAKSPGRPQTPTHASPRSGEVQVDTIPPKNFKVQMVETRTGTDKDGRPTFVQEMPLPHVYEDINAPKPGSNKGAASSVSNSELFKGLRK